ncbi:MAG: DsrE/DsrF/DrsH-like family protein [Bacteroidetes bacterium]|nr:DsrE/DsrF/DrsH-like family protein [Bacteroidota bacterium]MBP7399286.1 DsrE/DsrF/DrsH-like family protein [Chitinophagales bacterium]MBP8754206.1 DsrE/DsrF/DrsH-like family protein [Chitinophagales bacterium]MBP9189982.1 DsrE/DsrF/DrsH-like family protein [Chitinophagales bacterium]
MKTIDKPIKKVCIICAKGTLEDVYAALVLANGAVMDGIEARLFFTFFGLEAITKKTMDHLHTSVVGNPAMRLPGGMQFPSLLGIVPGMEAMASEMMKKKMEELDVPPVSEFLDMIEAGGGEVYACKLAVDMFKLKPKDLSHHVKGILTVGEFYELAAGDGSQIIFV